MIPVGNLKVGLSMKEKPDVFQGMLALMVLKTLEEKAETSDWKRTAAMIARVFEVKAEDLT
jgi:hypothetical protein